MYEQRLGSRYLLADRLGGGGMGEVFLAYATHGGDEQLAVKLLRQDLAEDPDLVSRFLQESRLLRGIRHPNVVRVLDLVAEGDRFGIVMEYVPDGDLRRSVPFPCPVPVALDLLAQVAEGLAAIHAAGITHRDLKPENVLVHRLPDGSLRARVTDFGVSHRSDSVSSRHDGIVGTAGYLSPESANGLRAGPGGDVYALGVILYEMCVGRRPFVSDNTLAVIRAHADSPVPRPPAITDPLWELLSQLLAKDPQQRPSAAAAAERMRAVNGPGEVASVPLPGPMPVSAQDPTLVRAPGPAGSPGPDPEAFTLVRPGAAHGAAPEDPAGRGLAGRGLAGGVPAGGVPAEDVSGPAGAAPAFAAAVAVSAGAAAVPPGAGSLTAGPGPVPSGAVLSQGAILPPGTSGGPTVADRPGATPPGFSRRALREADGRRRRRWSAPVAAGVLVLVLVAVLMAVLRLGGPDSGSQADGTASPTTASVTATAPVATPSTPATTTTTVTVTAPAPSKATSTRSSAPSTPAYPVPAIPALTLDPPASSLRISDGRAGLSVNGVDPGAGTVSSIMVIYEGGTLGIAPIAGVAGPYRTTVTGLVNGKAYGFTVRVCNSFGECSTSRAVAFTPYTWPTLQPLHATKTGLKVTLTVPAITRNGNPRTWTCRVTADTFPHDLRAPNKQVVPVDGVAIQWDPLGLHDYTARESCTDGTTVLDGPVLTFRT